MCSWNRLELSFIIIISIDTLNKTRKGSRITIPLHTIKSISLTSKTRLLVFRWLVGSDRFVGKGHRPLPKTGAQSKNNRGTTIDVNHSPHSSLLLHPHFTSTYKNHTVELKVSLGWKIVTDTWLSVLSPSFPSLSSPTFLLSFTNRRQRLLRWQRTTITTLLNTLFLRLLAPNDQLSEITKQSCMALKNRASFSRTVCHTL